MPKKLINNPQILFPLKAFGLLLLLFGMLFFILSFQNITHKIKPKGVKIVVIDAGHGGKDPGCNGVSHTEKEVTLAVALKLGKLIEENIKDVKVIYTRKTDVFVELEERAQIANRNNADLFISIHCNAAAKYVTYKDKNGKVRYKTWKDKKGKIHKKEVVNPGPYGSETYVMGIKNEKGQMEVAKRENAAMLLEDNYEKTYDGFDPNSDEAYIIMSLLVKENVEQSAQFAAKIQNEYKAKAGRIDKGVQRQSIWVLWRSNMPSILTEVGFLTNPQEEKFLASEKGQNYMASAIFRAFRNYKNEQEGKIVKYDDEFENQEALENENVLYAKEHPNEIIVDSTATTDSVVMEEKTPDPNIEKYNKLKLQADEKVKETKWDEATKLYNDLLKLKANDEYAKNKIAEIEKFKNDKDLQRKEDEKKKAALEADKKYKDIIAKADKYFNSKLWQDAKKAYTDAAVFNPGDKYPKQRIAEIEKIQKDLEDKQTREDSAKVESKDIINNYVTEPKKEEVKSEIIFSVQFGSGEKEPDKTSAKYTGLDDLSAYKVGGVYKYTSGKFNKPADAVKHQTKVRGLGYKDAFVVAFKNGTRIDYNEAVKLVQ